MEGGETHAVKPDGSTLAAMPVHSYETRSEAMPNTQVQTAKAATVREGGPGEETPLRPKLEGS